MKLLSIIAIVLLASCNNRNAEPIEVVIRDSISADNTDSLRMLLKQADSLKLYTAAIKHRINYLEYKAESSWSIHSEQNASNEYMAPKRQKDNSKMINDLLDTISKYKREVIYLQQRLAQREINYNKVIGKAIEHYIDKPNDSSLIIELDAGNTKVNNVDVYIVPFTRKARSLMQYEIGCDYSRINKLDGKQAGYYEGQYFFNNIPPGKYLVKLCTYYGGYKIVNRLQGEQLVKMQVSPPIQ